MDHIKGAGQEEVLESLSKKAISRLGKLTESVIEEYVMLFSVLRRKVLPRRIPRK